MSRERQKRREEIQRALSFIKSPLPYPEPEAFEGFVIKLVCNLLDEGNAAFRERRWMQAQADFSEGVSVALYAQDEGLHVPAALLESLYINRAAAHQNMEGNALSSLDDWDVPPPLEVMSFNGVERVTDAAVGLTERPSPVLPAPVPVSDEDPTMFSAVPESGQRVALSVPVSQPLEDNDLMGDELDILLDCMSKEEDTPQSGVVPSGLVCFSSSSPRHPPAFCSYAGSQLNALDSFAKPDVNSDGLDTLDSICPPQVSCAGSDALQRPLVVGGDALNSLSEFSLPGGKVCPSFLPSVKLKNEINPAINPHTRNGHVTSTLSCLSKNPLEHTHEFTQACSSCFTSTGSGVLDFEFRSDVTHSCKKDLLLCRRRGGANSPWRRIRPRPTHKNFHGAFVLCREILENQVCKFGEDCTFAYCQEEIDVWTQERRGLLVRELLFNPLATNQRQALSVIKLLNMHTGMFMFLCEVCFDCKHRIISKRWKENPALCANLQTQHQFDKNKCLVHVVKNSTVCYSKIRVLSPHCQLDMCHHKFRFGCKREDACCFAHSLIELQTWILQRDSGITPEEIVQESKIHWNKQPPAIATSRLSNKNTAAKSNSPLKAEDTNGKAGPVQGTGIAESAEVKGHSLELKFVCGQCWRDGLVSEPDRALKYCTAKARHSWTKERRVLLVKSHEKNKWVTVRPLPFAKTFPQQFDICVHVMKQRKCQYIGNCTFAHSQEEKDLWTYMKNNGFRDIQQVYDIWLSTSNQNRQSDGTSLSQPMEEKQITMPTDFAEPMPDSFYCPLCGKHSNSDRQWQQHISSDKHKQRVLSGGGEDESLAWSYRFPGPCFSICTRLEEGCPDGVSCDFAHSEEELQEWRRRRDYLRRRLDKARAHMLMSPNDNDFGIYNFLLQD
ncbi:zinc finger CCCH domain-containing protein 7A-like [Xyrauchen texanus]|uniref:zinc finger CCCH domain-containing protein 7A-like n=1 Tax=Xyrauchen texanus TaxID=154827 RepID=UPI002242BDB2|nr:zinc finger CCCH domain-containing protein 7A-like [Xyrauchen texanus]